MSTVDSKVQVVDIEMAKRFAWFRNEYVSEKQIEASKLINCSQGKLSEIEAAKRKIDFKTLRTLSSKYGLNTDWLATGYGEPIIEVQESLPPDDINAKMKHFEKEVRELKTVVLDMERAIKLMEANQTYFIKRMEQLLGGSKK
jgi:hypothetical protein